MKRLLLLIFSLNGLFALNAQSIQSIKGDVQTYLWGEGKGTTLKAADQAALADIIGQISTQVESNFERIVTEKDNKFKETVNDVVKTYSSATLTNTVRIVMENEPDAKVFRYIRKSEIAKIFESRKNKIIELARNGETALGGLQIADALRYFYWSQTLLRSHPDASAISMTDKEGKASLLITWLPMQINQIFANMKIAIDIVEQKETYNNCIFDIKYNDQPVRNFDYTYWDGQNWSNIVSAKDGVGVAELPKSISTSEIRLKGEYSFEGEANIDMELRTVMEKLPLVPYKSCYLNLSKNTVVKAAAPVMQMGTAPAVGEAQTLTPLDKVTDKNDIMKKVTAAIAAKRYTEVQSLFTDDGYSIFKSLLQYGNAKIVKSFDLKYYQFGSYVICRSIPMSFSFKANDRQFVENVVFYFDATNKICNITFSLSKNTVDDISANTTWSQDNRILLMSFLENYMTAYSLKRFDYINKIFSDDALIITGIVTKINNSPELKYTNNGLVKYNKQTKTEYMKKLKYSFDSNEFINIRFADNTIRRSGKGNDVYGIQIKQDYFSTNYGDSGYLFLLVDLSDSKTPQIHVRTWQPEKNPDGSIYGLSDF
ncbi:MAG: LPP20 family lipoprotein [Bacteroidales bacterium]